MTSLYYIYYKKVSDKNNTYKMTELFMYLIKHQLILLSSHFHLMILLYKVERPKHSTSEEAYFACIFYC